MVAANQTATLFAGGEEPARAANGTVEPFPFGVQSEVKVTSADGRLATVDVTVRHRELNTQGPQQGWTAARFVGVVPVGKRFRFAGGDIWAELLVEHVSR
jgi:hypothetical protein